MAVSLFSLTVLLLFVVCAVAIKDHYAALGLTPSASLQDIRKAYKKLAVMYHPDKNQGDDLSLQRFLALNEAHEVLADREKRREYDLERSRKERGYDPSEHNFGFRFGSPPWARSRVSMTLTSKYYHYNVLPSDGLWLLLATADLCTRCRVVWPQWEGVAEDLSDLIHFAHFDAYREPYITQDLQIRQIPTVVALFENRKVIFQSHQITVDSLTRFMEELFPSRFIKELLENDLESFFQFDPNGSHKPRVLFVTRAASNPLYHRITAQKLSNAFAFSHFRIASKDISAFHSRNLTVEESLIVINNPQVPVQRLPIPPDFSSLKQLLLRNRYGSVSELHAESHLNRVLSAVPKPLQLLVLIRTAEMFGPLLAQAVALSVTGGRWFYVRCWLQGRVCSFLDEESKQHANMPPPPTADPLFLFALSSDQTRLASCPVTVAGIGSPELNRWLGQVIHSPLKTARWSMLSRPLPPLDTMYEPFSWINWFNSRLGYLSLDGSVVESWLMGLLSAVLPVTCWIGLFVWLFRWRTDTAPPPPPPPQHDHRTRLQAVELKDHTAATRDRFLCLICIPTLIGSESTQVLNGVVSQFRQDPIAFGWVSLQTNPLWRRWVESHHPSSYNPMTSDIGRPSILLLNAKRSKWVAFDPATELTRLPVWLDSVLSGSTSLAPVNFAPPSITI